jgi:hypothetical protein
MTVTESTGDKRLKTTFANILDQSPGTEAGGRLFKLVSVDEDTYMVVLQGSRCTVFTVYPDCARVLPASEYGQSTWDYLCLRQVPKDGLKEQRFSVDLERKLPQGARNFASRVSTKFDLHAATSKLHAMGKR